MKILLAPNEDGFGTSAWAMALAQALLQQSAEVHVVILVASEQHYQFHRNWVEAWQRADLVRLALPRSPIQVAKENGQVDITRTIDQTILPYTAVRAEYHQLLDRRNLLPEVDMVIDLGVPMLVRAAWLENHRRREIGLAPLRTLTLFDHAWSFTLAQIGGQNLPAAARAQLAALATDEALTGEVLLFDEPVAPKPFHLYWRSLRGQPAHVIPGVLGGPGRTLAFAGLPGRDAAQARQAARALLGISDERPLLFITGGGTAVWHTIMGELLDSYLADPPAYHVVLYNPAEAQQRGVEMRETAVSFANRTCRLLWGRLGPLIFIDTIHAETHHVLFAACDLVLTRAGGGTVSDAIAHRAPLLLVEEPGMWQVEQIRESCLELSIAASTSLTDFHRRGRRLVEDQQGELLILAQARQAMTHIPHHVEDWLVDHILSQA